MMGTDDAEASMDPWTAVPLVTGETILFGFAVRHPSSGGLVWMTSSELLVLDEDTGLARTRSGRRYRLGRRFDALDVSGEGEEPRTAFELLVGALHRDREALLVLDGAWLTACKMARHLELPAPSRAAADVAEFHIAHAAAYVARRRGRTA